MNSKLIEIEEIFKDLNPEQRHFLESVLDNYIGILKTLKAVTPDAVKPDFIKVDQELQNAKEHFVVYTDGDCKMYHGREYGAGGWGFIITQHDGDNMKTICENAWFSNETTTEQMALEAILRAVQSLPVGASCIIRTDSIDVVGWMSLGKKRFRPDIAHLCSQIESMIAHGKIKASIQHVDSNNKDEQDARCEQLSKLNIIPLRARPDIAA